MLYVVLLAYAIRLPKIARTMFAKNVSNSYVRKTALSCSNNIDVQNDGFLLMSNIDWLHNSLPKNIDSDNGANHLA
uniref:Uncharacterized protein n=1 Tax=Quercus lobata TaxID=97700 RepID=A0A7N2L1R9_QUELO